MSKCRERNFGYFGRAICVGVMRELTCFFFCGFVVLSRFVSFFLLLQVIAKIDPSMCVNCGACYTSCNDAGYQSITMDPVSHITEIVDFSAVNWLLVFWRPSPKRARNWQH